MSDKKIDVYDADALIRNIGFGFFLETIIDDDNEVTLSTYSFDIKLSKLKEIVAIMERVEVWANQEIKAVS